MYGVISQWKDIISITVSPSFLSLPPSSSLLTFFLPSFFETGLLQSPEKLELSSSSGLGSSSQASPGLGSQACGTLPEDRALCFEIYTGLLPSQTALENSWAPQLGFVAQALADHWAELALYPPFSALHRALSEGSADPRPALLQVHSP